MQTCFLHVSLLLTWREFFTEAVITDSLYFHHDHIFLCFLLLSHTNGKHTCYSIKFVLICTSCHGVETEADAEVSIETAVLQMAPVF